MQLELNTLYKAKVDNIAFGSIPKEVLTEIISSGRICGVLLEAEIASRFENCERGTQGEAPDLIDKSLGTIQAKTYHSTVYEGTIKQGKNKGTKKSSVKDIFTTKSGLWDSMKRRVSLGEDVEKQIVEYFDKYDCFCYIDISNMINLEFSFVVVSSDIPKQNHVMGRISFDDILSSVSKTIQL